MKTAVRSLRWTPATVSWLSFVILGLVVAGVGLTGTAHVVGYLHERLLAHGIDHNREIAAHLAPRLRPLLAAGEPSVPQTLQAALATYGAFGYRLFVVDRAGGRLVADSDARGPLPAAVSASWFAAAQPIGAVGSAGTLPTGPASARCEDDHPMLIWFQPLPGADGEDWLLGVASDEKTVSEFLGELHWHLDGVMLLTYLLIAVLGYFAMRRIGRAYERNLEAQVRDRTRALETAHAEILSKTRLATIGQTASVLAHEMRNPLASIKLALTGLRGVQRVGEREQRRVELVVGEVDRLDGLLSETLDYVRPIRLSTKPVLLDRLLDQVIQRERPLIDAHRLVIERTPCAQCTAIRLDEGKMHQVLLNLLKNAIEASPPGGTIGIRPFRDADAVVLEIANDGPPLDAHTLARAFEPFFTTKPKGSGLGLGLVRRVVEEHGGSVRIASDAEQGTRVTLRLPA